MRRYTHTELQRAWNRIGNESKREILRVLLKFKVKNCGNFYSPKKCRGAVFLEGEKMCNRCCIFCDEFLSCFFSFTCPLIHRELEKIV